MPTVGLEAGVVLLLLLPGFISAKIIEAFCPATKRSEFERVTDAFIHTLCVVALYGLLVPRLPLRVNTWVEGGRIFYDVEVFRERLFLLLGLAVGWGCLVMVCKNLDFPWRWLRKIGASYGSARSSVWHDAFYEHKGKCYVQVELKNGRNVVGYVSHYSQDADEGSLFVEDAAWVSSRPDGTISRVNIPGPGILLTKQSDIVNVLFLTPLKKRVGTAVGKS